MRGTRGAAASVACLVALLAAACAGPSTARAADVAAPTVARYRVAAASTIDIGWTGIAHHQPWAAEQPIELGLACGADGECSVQGGAADAIFGAPVPLSAGGVPACIVSRLREPLSGHVGATSGCGELRLALRSTVYTGIELGRPCPVCVGDRTPNDGRADGRCAGGESAGKPCDANAVSKLFGATSNACLPPSTAGIGSLTIDLAPLTTGSVHLTADAACKTRRPGMADHCYCAGQPQPNACDSGTCGDKELCEAPLDGACSGQPFRSCLIGSGTLDCEKEFRGAGTCKARVRPCFGDTITATGTCDRAQPTYVALFCASATQAAGINNAAGLPGPARLRLTLRAVPPAEAKSAAAPRRAKGAARQ
ncbi:MAG TPA: hypothetical protein VGK30_21300 [Candidatus Binatia bacterium]